MDDPNRRLDHEYGKRSKERMDEIAKEFDDKRKKKLSKLEKHLRNEAWKEKYYLYIDLFSLGKEQKLIKQGSKQTIHNHHLNNYPSNYTPCSNNIMLNSTFII